LNDNHSITSSRNGSACAITSEEAWFIASSHRLRPLPHLIGRLTMPYGEDSAMTAASAIQPRKLGRTGPAVFPIALGCMGMSGMYGPADESESLATIHAAIDAGVTLFDTGDFYGMGHNEMLLGQALRFFREKVLISVKFGAQRSPDGAWLGYDARPAAVKTALAYSLKRLGVDHIDIYRPARLDPNVPIEDTIGAIAEMIQAGYVRYIGLSEVGSETIRRAAAVHPITDLQIEYSLISRSPESKIFPFLEELGIAVTAYGVLSRGLLSGSFKNGPGDIRNRFPRFAAENEAQNQKLIARLAEIAAGKGISQSQLAVAWVLAKSPFIIPVIGARTRAQLAESVAALEVILTPAEVNAIEAAIPPDAVAGTRYDAHQMQILDSEK
jgi:aryl-alcohol dehydrogenase-like predicted oxidoreductase